MLLGEVALFAILIFPTRGQKIGTKFTQKFFRWKTSDNGSLGMMGWVVVLATFKNLAAKLVPSECS